MKTIILSIRRRHWNDIRDGKKIYELRKNVPGCGAPFKALCCISGTNGEVAGEFEVNYAVDTRHMEDYLVATRARVTPEELEKYRAKGSVYAWRISPGTVVDYGRHNGESHRHITEYGLTRPPRSWCYVYEDEEEEHG